ncbi:MAG: IS607 family transposase, partial [Mesorhizobium amorphae]
MTNDLIRLAEAASLLGVSRVTLDRWHHSGKFPADVMTPGGERRWSRSRIMGTRLGAAAETAPPP